MNTKLATAQALASAVAAEASKLPSSVMTAVCPPFPYLTAVKSALGTSPVMLGAQNACASAPGAFTGETAIDMLKDVGCRWVILGHSERRQLYGETDEVINKKVTAAIAQDLDVIFCIGELLADRQANRTEQVLQTQLAGGLKEISASALARIVIAYEPVWAIGTGVTATPEQAESAHAFVRGWIAKNYSAAAAEKILILYGGSVKPDNAKVLLSQPNVDGALVGGASLTPEQFLPIMRAAVPN